MARGLFVTGTDTGVGKTVVSAALLVRYRGQASLRYWKPIQTGIEQDDDTAEVRRLAGSADREIRTDGVRLERPVSPHLAARLAGRRIDLDALALDQTPREPPGWIVEGAGGALVPINERDLMTHLMRRLELAVVVVSRSTLGTINHTLMTLRTLRSEGLLVAGVVMVGPPNAENRAAIETYGQALVVAEMPWLEPLTPAGLQAWTLREFDTRNLLAEHFR